MNTDFKPIGIKIESIGKQPCLNVSVLWWAMAWFRLSTYVIKIGIWMVSLLRWGINFNVVVNSQDIADGQKENR
jgi:hypothetical protein